MGLTIAISTHGGYRDFLPWAVATAIPYGEVVVYDDGGECGRVGLGERYVALPKSGSLIPARVKAIEEASGDYLLHLDADDWLIGQPPMVGDMAYSDLMLNGVQCARRDVIDAQGCLELMRLWAGSTVRGRNPLPAKPVYRVAWLKEHGLSWYSWPSTNYAEDVRTLIEYCKHDPQVVRVNEPYYAYRVHAGQSTNGEADFIRDFDAYFAAARHEGLEP